MKNLIPISLACCLLFVACAPSRTSVAVQYNDGAAARVDVGYETFYHELSPYGRWIDYPGYGYVWVPNAEAGFRPYATGGHWVFTDYGWTWTSSYSWGWAPFHYGRWLFEDGYGWVWVPGHEWAPAWVTWGSSGGYYGWAPLAPGIRIGVSVGWTPPAHYWNFVPAQHITQVNVNNYVTNTTNNVTVVNNITKNVTIINNVTNNNTINNTTNKPVYNMGPQRTDVERVVNHPIQQVKVTESNQPGANSMANNQLAVYKPRVKEAGAGPKPAPEKVEAYNGTKSSPANAANSERPAGGRLNNGQDQRANAGMNRNALNEERKPAPTAAPQGEAEQNQARRPNRINADSKEERQNAGPNEQRQEQQPRTQVREERVENRPAPGPRIQDRRQPNFNPRPAAKPYGKRKKKGDD